MTGKNRKVPCLQSGSGAANGNLNPGRDGERQQLRSCSWLSYLSLLRISENSKSHGHQAGHSPGCCREKLTQEATQTLQRTEMPGLNCRALSGLGPHSLTPPPGVQNLPGRTRKRLGPAVRKRVMELECQKEIFQVLRALHINS